MGSAKTMSISYWYAEINPTSETDRHQVVQECTWVKIQAFDKLINNVKNWITTWIITNLHWLEKLQNTRKTDPILDNSLNTCHLLYTSCFIEDITWDWDYDSRTITLTHWFKSVRCVPWRDVKNDKYKKHLIEAFNL